MKEFIPVKVENMWEGNPISCVKTFGTRACKLCSKERNAILKLTRKTPSLAINKCNEVYGACHHRPHDIHRFDQSLPKHDANTGTDESNKDERVARPSSTTSTISSTSANSLESFDERHESEILSTQPQDDSITFGFPNLRTRGLLALHNIQRTVETDGFLANLPLPLTDHEPKPSQGIDEMDESGELALDAVATTLMSRPTRTWQVWRDLFTNSRYLTSNWQTCISDIATVRTEQLDTSE